jgi:hypothetical protein
LLVVGGAAMVCGAQRPDVSWVVVVALQAEREAVVFSVVLRLSFDNAAVVNALAVAYHHCLAVVAVRGP